MHKLLGISITSSAILQISLCALEHTSIGSVIKYLCNSIECKERIWIIFQMDVTKESLSVPMLDVSPGPQSVTQAVIKTESSNQYYLLNIFMLRFCLWITKKNLTKKYNLMYMINAKYLYIGNMLHFIAIEVKWWVFVHKAMRYLITPLLISFSSLRPGKSIWLNI